MFGAEIEQSSGVKVSSAAPAEAAELLNLEDRIHERMINQSYAVKVVASALRRARAGVANPHDVATDHVEQLVDATA